MKIYNQEKTQKINKEELDFERGYLKADKHLLAHHEATPLVKGKTAEQIYNELKADGLIAVRIIGGKYYTVDRAFENGEEIDPLSVTEWVAGVRSSSVTEIVDEPDTPAQEAYDDYEDIQVYVLYTEEELEEKRLARLRSKRVGLLAAFDKWEKSVLRGRESDDLAVMEWYKNLLDLKENSFEEIPKRIEYYL